MRRSMALARGLLLVLLIAPRIHGARVTFAQSANETRWVHRPAPGQLSFLQTAEPYVENPDGWRTWQPNSVPLTDALKYKRSMFKGLTDLNNEQLNPIKLAGPAGKQDGFAEGASDAAPQGAMPLRWRQDPAQLGFGKERKADVNIAATTYEVGRYKVGSQCTQAASAQFRNSKRLAITFMNNRFGGRMPPLVIATVQKPRTLEAWDHAYNANLVDVTPNGFVVEVARLDRDAGWCYELELQWMAYGFATGDEQGIGGGSESTAQQRT